MCKGELDVGNGFGERCVGGHQVLNGIVFLNCCVCQIIERRSHLLRLFEFGGLICTKLVSPAAIQLMLRISAKVAFQWHFQLGQMWSRSGQYFHLRQANVMLLHARVCLVPVVIIPCWRWGLLHQQQRPGICPVSICRLRGGGPSQCQNGS